MYHAGCSNKWLGTLFFANGSVCTSNLKYWHDDYTTLRNPKLFMLFEVNCAEIKIRVSFKRLWFTHRTNVFCLEFRGSHKQKQFQQRKHFVGPMQLKMWPKVLTLWLYFLVFRKHWSAHCIIPLLPIPKRTLKKEFSTENAKHCKTTNLRMIEIAIHVARYPNKTKVKFYKQATETDCSVF